MSLAHQIRSAAPVRNTIVYIVQNTRTGDVKIGFTSNLEARLRSLKSGAGADLVVIRHIDGGRPTEKWLHKRFSHLRRAGEWFAFHDEMLSVAPPDEVPVIPKVTVIRDVKLTVREKMKRCEKLASDLGADSKSKLLMFVSDLTEEQAEQVLSLIEQGCRDHARELREFRLTRARAA